MKLLPKYVSILIELDNIYLVNTRWITVVSLTVVTVYVKIYYIYMLKLFIDIRVTHLEYINDQR